VTTTSPRTRFGRRRRAGRCAPRRIRGARPASLCCERQRVQAAPAPWRHRCQVLGRHAPR